MVVAPIPSRESARLDALHRCHILDTPSEPAFDELAQLAAYVCRTPMAVISLVDATRQWFKSAVGLPFTESPRSVAFCAHTILGTDLFIVEEADADHRFDDHPWVVDSPSICFYAGVPLITPDGHAIGSLAVMDVVPRTLTPEQRAAMQTLANQVMAQCELRGRRSVRSREETDLAWDVRKVEADAYRWQQVFAQAEFGIAYGDIETGTILAVNPAFARQRGYDMHELIGQPVLMLYPPQERAAMAARFPVIDRTGHLTYETVHIRKDGTTFPVLMETTVIKDAHGRPMSRVALAADMTERKKAEEALRLSQERLHEALQASNTGLWEWNTETGEVSFSKEWKSQLGYGESELSDSLETWTSRLHPDDRERAIQYAQRYRDNPIGAFRQDFRLRHKDGSYCWIDSHASFVTEADGRQIRLLGSHTDITERKRMEEALRKSEERFRAAYRNAVIGMSTTDLNGRILEVNHALCAILGYSEEELLTRSFQSLAHPDDMGENLERVHKLLVGDVPSDVVEKRYIRKDGGIVWGQVGFSVIRDADGNPAHLLRMIQDISERKQAEDALQLAKFTVERATEAIYWVGAGAELLDVNEAACAMLGYSKDEFRRMTVHDINPHFQADSWPVYWEETRQRGAVSFESFHKAKDGRLIPIEVNVSFLSFQGRECHCAFVRDITERKQVEQQRAQALHSLQTIMETVPDIIFALDLQGRLSSWNKKMERVTGYGIDELFLKPALEMVPFEEAGRTAAAIREAFETGYAELEGHLLTKDGRTIPYHWTGAPFTDLQGRVIGITGVGRDMTERKRAEAALRLTRFSIERAVDAVFWIDAQARILDINDAACTVLGYTRGELLSMTVHDIDPNFPAAAWPSHWEELKARKSFAFETEHLRKDGTVIQTETTVNFLIHEGQEYNCAFMRDITDRKRVEDALRMTRFSVERVSDAVFWIDANARILDVNEAACVSLQYSREELLSLSLFEIDPHVTPENWSGLWRDKLERHSLTFESTQIRKDGTTFPVEITCNHLRFGGQEFCCAIRRDITERKDAEGRLKFSEERFRLVGEATNDILWDWDLVTQDHWWSPNAQEKFGYIPDEEPSVTAWMDRLHPDDRGQVSELVDRALASDARTVTAEYRFRLADGSYGHFYDRGQIVRNASGQAIRMIGAMIDVTFSKRAYASLEVAYQRLQSMSRELQAVESNERRRLSRELHDEVGQLLTGLKFDLQATRQALGDPTTAAVARARERTLRALETTDELFARLRHLVRALRPSVLEELGLKAALEALVSDVQSRSDLVCSVSIDTEGFLSLTDTTVETALYRMAQELTTNVVRHGQAMTMSILLTMDSRHWMLTVQDDGVGFDPQAEPFIGMGLRGVRERAEILGGHVDISSIPGAGSTVTVWIPVAGQAPEKA